MIVSLYESRANFIDPAPKPKYFVITDKEIRNLKVRAVLNLPLTVNVLKVKGKFNEISHTYIRLDTKIYRLIKKGGEFKLEEIP